MVNEWIFICDQLQSMNEKMFHPIGPLKKHEGLDWRMVYENKDE
jgi:hypothetical protein